MVVAEKITGLHAVSMIAWALSLWTSLGLRVRLTVIACMSVVLALGYLYLRFKIASTRAKTAEQKAEKLEQTRKLEQRIASARAKTRAQQEKLREQIKERKKNDYFER
jgi:predicted Holliday junction resolvase-like endonuclease